ncbi:hypothetical protein Btru_052738 [Bulinus truncatus]|nr:hypothetical protein Btru_052738 [Bulinus truncatus]
MCTGQWRTSEQVHPTFLRVIPPDSYHVMAILNFMKYNKWQYFSVVAQDDEFGRATLKILRRKADDYHMCLPVVIRVSDASDFSMVLDSLLAAAAKVVVSLISETAVAKLIKAIEAMGSAGKLIWVSSDRWLEFMYASNVMEGTFVVSSSPLELKGFPEYFSRLNFNRNTNPWFARALREQLGCSTNECATNKLKKSAGKLTLSSADIYDTMMTFAHGLHDMFSSFCPGAASTVAVECFNKNSDKFFQHLKSVNFSGESGQVFFNEKGNRLTILNVFQTVRKRDALNMSAVGKGDSEVDLELTSVERVAYYDIKSEVLHSFDNLTLNWVKFDLNETFIHTKCKVPCQPNEYKSYVKGCCWLCRKCQDNERIIDNDTACQKCPPLYWPAMVNNKFSVCQVIEVTVFDWFHPATLALLISNGIGVLLVFFVLATLWMNQGTSEEDSPTALVIIQLVAIVWGFMAVPIFLMRPTPFNCNTAHILYQLSFSVLYIAMLLRTVEVYRKCLKVIEDYELKLTSRGHLVTFTVLLSIVKIITFSTLGVLFPVRAVNLQPIISEKLVELVCDIPVPHTIAFLLFSMVLLLLCSIFSLKSQNDPYGFERNRFVSMFVVISLIMWIAFMPAYFTAIHHRMRTYFRILAILVNHTSALILNFTPAFLEVCLRRRKDSGPGGFGYFRSSRQSVTAPAMMAVVPARSRDKADKGKPGPGEMAESQREGHKITFNLHSKLRSSNSHLSSRDNPWNVDPR